MRKQHLDLRTVGTQNPTTDVVVQGHNFRVGRHRNPGPRSMNPSDHVTTSNLNKAVARNRERFPSDFMFQLTAAEADAITNLSFQSGIASSHGGRRTLPYVFTQEGVAMLSGVLRSPHAVAVNILIMRAFVWLRIATADYQDLERRINELETKTDGRFTRVFAALRELLQETTTIRHQLLPAAKVPEDQDR